MNLGTIKGNPILSINVESEEQGHIKVVKTYKEAYYLINELKKQDRKEGIKDRYTLALETIEGYYYGYTIRKGKYRFIIK